MCLEGVGRTLTEIIEALGMYDAILARWQKTHDQMSHAFNNVNRKTAVTTAALKGLTLILQVAILAFAAHLALQDKLTAGSAIASTILIWRALAPLEGSIAHLAEFLNARQAYEEIKIYLNTVGIRPSTIALPEPQGAFDIEHLCFRYPNMKDWVLLDINLHIEPGTLLTIVGPSAAGKSTLIRLLTGILCPTQGHIRMDNAEVYTWNRHQFGQFVGYMPQVIDLFDATVKENIARLEESSEDAIIQAAQMAGAHDLILFLPNGYDTDVHRGGKNLSAGQRQHIALARALFSHPKVVLLDEPTSHMDERAQRTFLKTIQKLKAQKVTVIIATHRAHIIQMADQLLFLKNGKILGFGPTTKVLEEIKKYAA